MVKSALVRTHEAKLSLGMGLATTVLGNYQLSEKTAEALWKLRTLRRSGDELFHDFEVREREKEQLEAEKGALERCLDDQVESSGKVFVCLQVEIDELKVRLIGVEEENVALKDSNSDLLGQSEKLKADLAENKLQVMTEHKNGFEKAIHQACLLFKNVEFDRFDIFKDVKDGALVDEAEFTNKE